MNSTDDADAPVADMTGAATTGSARATVDLAALRAEAQPLIDADRLAWRSCWHCNMAHRHMREWDDIVVNCFECGRWFFQGVDITIYDDPADPRNDIAARTDPGWAPI